MNKIKLLSIKETLGILDLNKIFNVSNLLEYQNAINVINNKPIGVLEVPVNNFFKCQALLSVLAFSSKSDLIYLLDDDLIIVDNKEVNGVKIPLHYFLNYNMLFSYLAVHIQELEIRKLILEKYLIIQDYRIPVYFK